jgi:hypothetical protein
MKPDWKDAPEWAQYVAMDEDGDWYWYELKPELLDTCWLQSVSGQFDLVRFPFPEWQDSLEERPGQTIVSEPISHEELLDL